MNQFDGSGSAGASPSDAVATVDEGSQSQLGLSGSNTAADATGIMHHHHHQPTAAAATESSSMDAPTYEHESKEGEENDTGEVLDTIQGARPEVIEDDDHPMPLPIEAMAIDGNREGKGEKTKKAPEIIEDEDDAADGDWAWLQEGHDESSHEKKRSVPSVPVRPATNPTPTPAQTTDANQREVVSIHPPISSPQPQIRPTPQPATSPRPSNNNIQTSGSVPMLEARLVDENPEVYEATIVQPSNRDIEAGQTSNNHPADGARTDVGTDANSTSWWKRNQRYIIGGVFILLVALVAILGVSLLSNRNGTSNNNGDGASDEGQGTATTTTGTDLILSDAPSLAPSTKDNPPTVSPTTTPPSGSPTIATRTTTHHVKLIIDNIPIAGYSLPANAQISTIGIVRDIIQENLDESFLVVDVTPAPVAGDNDLFQRQRRRNLRRRLNNAIVLPLVITVRGPADIAPGWHLLYTLAAFQNLSDLEQYLMSVDEAVFGNVDISMISADQTTQSPSKEPTKSPTKMPSKSPTEEPTKEPTQKPSNRPTIRPTNRPTPSPTPTTPATTPATPAAPATTPSWGFTTSTSTAASSCSFCPGGLLFPDFVLPTDDGATCEEALALADARDGNDPTCYTIKLAESFCCPPN